MAMSGGKDDGEPMMEMNTTPLIDVMLVLLIMLMITIPPVSHAVNIDLPQQNVNPPPEDLVDPVVNKIIILPDSTIQWNGTPVTLQQVGQYLKQTKSMTPEPELQFQPASTAPYDTVDKTLVVVKISGISKFGFVGNEQYSVFGKAARDGR
ncbi:biopolymer transporter ExbD [Sphingorhabdus sp. IMCC26285]|uniref:Biopolymer transporter ExbD n=1 Tax=Sphingorhabdus profundilacus TaxID=2509718 RepID=A0A6I4LXI5_9SPHN|nr:biopolymer transporter ExbD [Sphingorhabdus profundilacus]MVZ97741.1 biopolymer transporter ExbD [Sphingorhabdus profundilacus]